MKNKLNLVVYVNTEINESEKAYLRSIIRLRNTQFSILFKLQCLTDITDKTDIIIIDTKTTTQQATFQ